MLLEEQVADAAMGPVGTEVGSSLRVENVYSMAYGFRTMGLRELAAGTEEWLEGCHHVA